MSLLLFFSLSFLFSIIGCITVTALVTFLPKSQVFIASLFPRYKHRIDALLFQMNKAGTSIASQSFRESITSLITKSITNLKSILKRNLRQFILDIIGPDISHYALSAVRQHEAAKQAALLDGADSELESEAEAARQAEVEATTRLAMQVPELAVELSSLEKRVTSLFDAQSRLIKGINGGYHEVERVKKGCKVVEDVLGMVVETMDWKLKNNGIKARAGVRSLGKYLDEEEDNGRRGVRYDEDNEGGW